MFKKSAAPSGGYNLTNSLRFRSSASAYLNRTFGAPTLSTKWTWSGWFKLGDASTYYTIFDGGSPDTRFGRDPSTNQLYVNNDTTNFIITTPVYRDYSAWYHAVLAFDSSQGTASNRLRLYINGSEVTAFATDNRSSISGAIGINTATAHGIGRQPAGGSAYFDGYMADINFVDGQQLTPFSFGTTSDLGVWQPIRYGGSYGNNGFYLKFTDTTSTTTLGYDSSPNSNNWTTNNFSLTAGVTYDSMTDVPTLTSATVANYAVLNPLSPTTSGNMTLSYANMQMTTSAANRSRVSTALISSGKWYAEAVFSTSSGNLSGCMFGLVSANDVGSVVGSYVGSTANSYGYNQSGDKYNNGSSSGYGASYAPGDVIGIAFDADAGSVTFYKNNSSQGTAFTGLSTSSLWSIGISGGISSASANIVVDINFGQRPFTYTPPSGFVALNTFNLPTPTIGATASTTANKYMDATLYTGNGSTQSITNSGSMQPDLVWIKVRSNALSHCITDAVRGTNLQLASNSTGADQSTTDGITAFNSNGFSLGAGTQQYSSVLPLPVYEPNAEYPAIGAKQ